MHWEYVVALCSLIVGVIVGVANLVNACCDLCGCVRKLFGRVDLTKPESTTIAKPTSEEVVRITSETRKWQESVRRCSGISVCLFLAAGVFLILGSLKHEELDVAAVSWDWTFHEQRAVRGSGGARIVHSEQAFDVNIEVQSRFSHGWLYLIDKSAGHMLKPLTQQGEYLVGEFSDQFDANTGWELFLVILSDRDVPELMDDIEQAARWLTEEDLRFLQQASDRGDLNAAEQRIRHALEHTDLSGVNVEIFVQLFDHRK